MVISDRRYRKTEDEITESMIRLLILRPIQEISVSDLTKDADINRSTFYLHYASLDGVLGTLEDKTINLLSTMTNFLGMVPSLFCQELVALIFDNKSLFLGVSHSFSYRYFTKLMDLFVPLTKVVKPLKSKRSLDPRYQKLGSLISSIVVVLTIWLDSNCRQNKEKLANEIQALVGSEYYKDLIKR
jgi:hypothetical protein